MKDTDVTREEVNPLQKEAIDMALALGRSIEISRSEDGWVRILIFDESTTIADMTPEQPTEYHAWSYAHGMLDAEHRKLMSLRRHWGDWERVV